MEWLTDNYASLMIVMGIALLVLEVGVFGFSVFILFFIGLACIATGLLTMIGILDESLIAAFGSIAVFTLVFAMALWKPLKKMQNSADNKSVKGDFIGHSFTLQENISAREFGSHKYSGITWKIKSEAPIAAGTEVEVTRADVGELTVIAKQ